jgi:hypothetical protein
VDGETRNPPEDFIIGPDPRIPHPPLPHFNTHPPVPGSALGGYWGGDGSQHVNFIGVDGHLHQLYHDRGHGWADIDLTNIAI